MPLPQHLSRAPVTEALLDIQVRLAAGVGYETLAPFCDAIAADYPQRRLRTQWTAEINLPADGQATATTSDGAVIGFILSNALGTDVVQARTNGFAFSRLPPYSDWTAVEAEAQRLWKIYLDVANPISVERVALRFINRMLLPLPMTDFRDFVLTAPEIAQSLPQELAQFLMRLVVPVASENAVVVITETIEQPVEAGNRLPFILDIEASKVVAADPKDVIVWDTFSTLHVLKNRFFFESITDKAVELFR